MWRNHFSWLFNVHGVSDVRHTEIHTAEPLVPELSPFEVKMATEEVKIYKSTSTDQIPGEGIKATARTIRSDNQTLINLIWNNKELSEERKELINGPIYKQGDKKDGSNYGGISLLQTTYKVLSNILLSRLYAHC
jgi:hypothetical protein